MTVHYSIGVDLGGTKVLIALADSSGQVHRRLRLPTEFSGGAPAVVKQIADAVKQIREETRISPVGIGVGVAGQIEAESGIVLFAPNLDWRNIPFRSDLESATGLPVAVTNDVRAATWGEWIYGAGMGCDDLVCLFVGTGVGGGVVAAGRMITGCGNAAGEVGHITIEIRGPVCHCGNRGCLEAFAGGWAIGDRAREAAEADPEAGSRLIAMAGGNRELITAATVGDAYHAGDPLAARLIDNVVEALTAGAASLVNAFNPCRLILGGGVITGIPELLEGVRAGLGERALAVSLESLEVLPARLGNDAGVIGAAALAIRTFSHGEKS